MTSEHSQSQVRESKFLALRSPKAILLFVLTAAIGLSADLWTKSHSWKTLAYGLPERDPVSRHLRVDSDTYEAIPGWLHFKVTVNEGAVFGMGQGRQMLFAVVSAGAIAFLAYLFITSGTRRLYQFILGLLLAGVLGNLYDRLVFGYVRDMLYMLPGREWPGTNREIFPWIFNLADTFLCVGVGLMVVYSFVAPDPMHGSAKSDDDDRPVAQPAQS